ncbi:MAG: hypothetical protein JJ850_06140 [Kordiimonadaceae bacterium]|nr:hypothetical protein [Kordiimonadaceae bacterium]MBO6568095.1 hypothetical protein [Kordiimonadaceae bacterium]MBO6964175.1 hypothetical protein [Kordiimonadaceae bacterium]
MESAGTETTGGSIVPSAPRGIRVAVSVVELALVILIAYVAAQLFFKLTASDPQTGGALPIATTNTTEMVDAGRLTSFDPFYREIGGPAEAPQQTEIRESSLRLELFGLRAASDGTGAAIIKTPDGDQKLVKIGDRIAAGVTLSAVYPDRLEVNRAGVREAIYLRPQRERQARSTLPRRPQAARPIDDEIPLQFDLSAFELSPVRRDRRIVGFQVPDPLPLPLLGSGLEAGDIVMEANGEPIRSFERLEELSEELSGSRQLTLEIERRGERRNLVLSLGGSR